MANLKDLIVNGSARILGTLYANLVGNASTATTLQTGRNIQTNLASTSASSFNGSANVTPGVTGTLAVGNGGTGQTSVANIQAGKDGDGNTISSTYAKKSTLATVATSGSYNDLSNKPTIPTVNNATLTIQKNGTTVNSFTANASSNVTANITVPTQASDIGAQATLVSGTNIKTINNESILGSGNIDIQGGGGLSYTAVCPAITPSSGVATWTVTHNLDSTAVQVSLYANGQEIEKNVTITSSNVVTLTFSASSTVAAGSMTVVILASGGNVASTSSRSIGEIVHSIIPLTDAGLHLLDGSVISGSGSYSEFVTYIAGLVSTYPNLFETEANWQNSVANYGVCGKFVYNSTNNTVRLPKITGIIEGTVDATALGDLVAAGLPNITGTIGVSVAYAKGTTGAFVVDSVGSGNGVGLSTTDQWGTHFNASYSNSIYGNSTTVQPQTIKAFYYIVIANSAKTALQIDIDEVATDLNGKADRDLSNVQNSLSNTFLSKMTPNYASGIAISFPANPLSTTTTTYTCPSAGILFVCADRGSVGGNTIFVYVNNKEAAFCPAYDAYATFTACTLVNKGDVVSIKTDSTSATWNLRRARFFPLKGV